MAGMLLAAGLLTGCLDGGLPEIPPTPVRTPLPTPDASPSGDVPAVRADASVGAHYYAALCTSCHGRAGAGDGTAAAALRPAPTDFTDRAHMREQAPVWYFRAIGQGVLGSAMQGWDHLLDPSARWDTAFYVWSLAVDPRELDRGAEIYRVRCSGCHGADGSGEPSARLDDPARVGGSRSTVAEALGAHHPAVLDGLGPDGLAAAVEHSWTFLYAPVVPGAP
jgi:mono/diheme cytochrome c family protein